MKINRYLIGILAVVALVLTGCGETESSSAAGGDSLTVTTTEFEFSPDTLAITADTAVSITVDNSKGVVEHDLTIDGEDVHIHADPGKKTTQSVTLPAGTYTMYCSVPGHRTSGMEGTVEVG